MFYLIYRFILGANVIPILFGLSGRTALVVYSSPDAETDALSGKIITFDVYVLYQKCSKYIDFFLFFILVLASASTRASSRPGSKASSRPGMRVLVDSIRSETPRPKSPHMNNEEPIELSHYPAAYKPPPGTKPKIERDDFPAPPYPYTDPGGCIRVES